MSWPIPQHLSAAELAALREHRRIAAHWYAFRAAPWWFPAVAVGSFLVLLGVLCAALAYVLEGVVAAVATVVLMSLAGAGFMALMLATSVPFAEGPVGHAALERRLASWLQDVARVTGGAPHVERDLRATLAFLDQHGMAFVPRDAFAWLHMARPGRHRLEGLVGGRPVAIEVVTGAPKDKPADGSVRPSFLRVQSSSDEGVGSHLFAFIAGASPATHVERRSHGAFELFTGHGGVTLVCSVRQGLPRPEVLLDAIARLGPWGPSVAFPPDAAVQVPARTTARDAIESFVAAVRDGDAERALLVAHPDLGVGSGVELSAATLASRMSSALGAVAAFRVDEVHEGSSGAEGTVEVRLASGGETRVIYLQLRRHLDAWRVSWVEGVGVFDQNPAGRNPHHAHLLFARRAAEPVRRGGTA